MLHTSVNPTRGRIDSMQTNQKANTYKDFTAGLSIRAQKVLIVVGGAVAALMYAEGVKILFFH